MRRWLIAAALVAGLAVATAVAARNVTVLVLDVPQNQATLLVKRSPVLGMGLLENEVSLCRRQRAGSPLHSVMLPATFCPAALATSSEANGSNVLVSMPFLPWLHRWAS